MHYRVHLLSLLMTFVKRFTGHFRNQEKSLTEITLLWVFALAFTLLRCADPEPPPIDPVPEEEEPKEFIDPLAGVPDEGPVSFENPVVGQRSYYVLFEAVKTGDNIDFQYKPDTLVFAITKKLSEAWEVTEFLTKGSNSRVNPENSYWGNWGDTLFLSYLQLELDSIHFYKDPEKLFVSFAFPREQKFPLQLVSDKYPNNPNGLPLFGASGTRWMEFTLSYTVFLKTFDRLNMYFNYTEMSGDGHGFTHVYGPSDGLVRTAWVSFWSSEKAVGWDLIPR